MGELIPIILFIIIGFVITFHLMTRSKERQLLIEKDISTEDLKILYSNPINRFNTAKWALIFLFGGIGMFIGIWLVEQTGVEIYLPAAIAVSIGTGLLVWQKVYGDKEKGEEE